MSNKLFGEVLDPVSVKNKDNRKILPTNCKENVNTQHQSSEAKDGLFAPKDNLN